LSFLTRLCSRHLPGHRLLCCAFPSGIGLSRSLPLTLELFPLPTLGFLLLATLGVLPGVLGGVRVDYDTPN
jgi:hypothetical protein